MSDQRVMYDALLGHKITPFFSHRTLSALAWMCHYCQSTSLSSAPAFRLPAVSSPPFCLSPLFWSPTRLLHWGWRVSAAILRLSGRPRRLLRRDPPSGARLSWHRAWGRACCQSLMSKRVLSGLFFFSRLLIVDNTRGLRVVLGGTPLTWHNQGSLEVTI